MRLIMASTAHRHLHRGDTGVTQGWGGTMNQLDAYLARLQAPA